jgi:hypothetical protein
MLCARTSTVARFELQRTIIPVRVPVSHCRYGRSRSSSSDAGRRALFIALKKLELSPFSKHAFLHFRWDPGVLFVVCVSGGSNHGGNPQSAKQQDHSNRVCEPRNQRLSNYKHHSRCFHRPIKAKPQELFGVVAKCRVPWLIAFRVIQIDHTVVFLFDPVAFSSQYTSLALTDWPSLL